MSKPTRKQIAISADLIARTLHALDELERPYVVLIDGIPSMFRNCALLHAAAIVEQQHLLNSKIQECFIENEAEKQTAIPESGEQGDTIAR